MQLNYDQQYQAFQREIRDFLAGNWRRKGEPDRIPEFRRVATDRGYLYRNIPKRFGGSEQTPDVLRALIITQEFAAAGAPLEVPGPGMMMLVPTLFSSAGRNGKKSVSSRVRSAANSNGRRAIPNRVRAVISPR